MKMGIKEMNFIHSLVGKRLLNVCCAAEILTFDFFPLALHASGYARIIKNSDILVTTLDYQSWELSESTNNDEWFNATLSPWNDLHIELDNGVIIECLIANSYPHYNDEQEQWVLFERGKDHKLFLTVYSKRVEFIE